LNLFEAIFDRYDRRFLVTSVLMGKIGDSVKTNMGISWEIIVYTLEPSDLLSLRETLDRKPCSSPAGAFQSAVNCPIIQFWGIDIQRDKALRDLHLAATFERFLSLGHLCWKPTPQNPLLISLHCNPQEPYSKGQIY